MHTRTSGLKLLQPFIRTDTNLTLVEKYLYINTRNEQEYFEYLYQVIGLILQGRKEGHDKTFVLQHILDFLHNQKFEWNHPMYKKYVQIENEQIDFLSSPMEVEEGVIQCGKCGSRKTLSFAKQTRSGDESTSVFAQCTGCGNKWQSA